MNADELRKIVDIANQRGAQSFWEEFKSSLFVKMKLRAEEGQREYGINSHDDMNIHSWLSKPHLYKKVIEELENMGYDVYHSDDVRDGIYITIRW